MKTHEDERSYTLETDYGLGGEKHKVIFFKALKGNDKIGQVIEPLYKLNRQLMDLMLSLEKTNPEIYEQIFTTRKEIAFLHSELCKQYNGYITY